MHFIRVIRAIRGAINRASRWVPASDRGPRCCNAISTTGKPTHITTDLTDLTDNMRGRYLHKSFPYPRSPLREFTPCAPGRSNPFYSLLIAHRLIVFATDRMDVAEAATAPPPALILRHSLTVW